MKRMRMEYVLALLACGLCYALLGGQGGCEDCTDNDQDGYAIEGEPCGEIDCDDDNADVNPGATEGPEDDPTCSDGLDNNCDGLVDDNDPSCSGVSLWGDMVWGQNNWGAK